MRIFEITREIYIGTYDIDFAGHVSNIVYLRWLEDMRLMVFDKYFPLEQIMEEGKICPVLASTEIEYKRPIKLFSKPIGTMWISRMGSASMTFSGQIEVDGQICTTAEHVGVFVSQESAKPVRLPKIILEQHEKLYSRT